MSLFDHYVIEGLRMQTELEDLAARLGTTVDDVRERVEQKRRTGLDFDGALKQVELEAAPSKRVLDFIAGNIWRSTESVAEHVGQPVARVAPLLARLERDGRVRRSARRWPNGAQVLWSRWRCS